MGGSPAIRALVHQITHEIRCQYRDVRYTVLTLALPVLLYVLWGTINRADYRTLGRLGPIYVMVTVTAFGLIAAAVGEFSVRLSLERTKGWNRMVRATPLSRPLYFAAKLVSQLLGAVLTVAVLFFCARFFYHVNLDIGEWVGEAAWLILCTIPFLAIGFVIGMCGSAAQPVAAVALILFVTLGGMLETLGNMPPLLVAAASYLPALSVLDEGLRIAQGLTFRWREVEILLAYAVGASGVALALDLRSTRT
ncbi:MAG: ABC transporter permease [Firmicutes bacterium]|nr:ABC transporter permease [Bacillota bacterium]